MKCDSILRTLQISIVPSERAPEQMFTEAVTEGQTTSRGFDLICNLIFRYDCDEVNRVIFPDPVVVRAFCGPD